MMDAELMQLVARFKLKLLRALNIKVDTYRFIAEKDYAMKILQIADQSEEEDLILLALKLAEYQGFLAGNEPPAPAKNPLIKPRVQEADTDEEAKKRYMFGARG
jgi:hypothetical protein